MQWLSQPRLHPGRYLTVLVSQRVRPSVQIPVGLLIAAGGLALLTRIGADSKYWSAVMPAPSH